MRKRNLALGAIVAIPSLTLFWAHSQPSHSAGAKPSKRAKSRVATKVISPAKLWPQSRKLGLVRQRPLEVGSGQLSESPAAALGGDGRLYVAIVQLNPRTETESLRLETFHLGRGVRTQRKILFSGPLVGNPRMASGPDGAVWLTFSGRSQPPRSRLDHERDVFVIRVAPDPSPLIRISEPGQRNDMPSLAVGDEVHVVWESSPSSYPELCRIAYQSLDPHDLRQVLQRPDILSEGPFDRRPSIAISERGSLAAAWDSWTDWRPTGAEDPDYDVFLRRNDGTWGAAIAIDQRPGIQAAPRVAFGPGGHPWVAYHSSHRHGLVKWWQARRLRDGQLEELSVRDSWAEKLPKGIMQGAEFPELAFDREGFPWVFTRPSHGAFLHRIDGSQVMTLSLARKPWGARGIGMQPVTLPKGGMALLRQGYSGTVLERIRPLRAVSPPRFAKVTDKVKKRRPGYSLRRPKGTSVYVGDVHMHSALSDGTGPPDEIYARAFVRGLDFAVLTEHDNMVGGRLFPSEKAEVMWTTDAFDRLSGFATLHGYEWTTKATWQGQYGHRNIYFKDGPPRALYHRRNGHGTTPSLHRALAKEQAFSVPHHTAWTGTDWRNANPAIQRHVEVVSVHGSSEEIGGRLPARAHKGGTTVRKGLALSKRFGFLGGSDGHGLWHHHGIARRRDPWDHGYTFVDAAALDRESIWKGLFERRTWAATDPELHLETAINGLAPGQRGPLQGAGVDIELRAAGPVSFRKALLVRNGKPIQTLALDGSRVEVRLTDKAPPRGRTSSYYIRLELEDQSGELEMAWTSPVFVDVPR